MIIDNAEVNEASVEDLLDDGRKVVHTFKHLGKLEPIQEIDAAHQFVEDLFKRDFFRANRPLVIRNALKHLPFGDAYKNWSLVYLLERCGTNRVHVRQNTLNDDYKTGRAYMVQEIEFREYVRDLAESNQKSQNSYLAVQNLRKAFPQIADELAMPTCVVEKFHAGPFLWIARDGHFEYTHMVPVQSSFCDLIFCL